MGTGTSAYAFSVTMTAVYPNNFTLTISPNPTCDVALGCCSVNLEKVEFAINANCRNTIQYLSGTPVQPLLPSFTEQTWPGPAPMGYTNGEPLLVGKVTGLCPSGSQPGSCMEEVTVHLQLDAANTNCNTADKFFLNGQFWYAAYGSTPGSSNNCCGTNGDIN
ncbi:hypothetical protein CEUSTIGMA_g7987.t1 [Chlamydomonas eustigma]|uniref:Pherophorin domain-containing protein n=1 Tax=Chlamydomonas eustigma TaxID=1157962 RepID=A0A250XCD9_9CHLO|nr:hypothetical protein CEUSTIGMA_g7987.t1 [Chlamydomonas eustigma]|eukprot:GAX80549.1 hypothetical protein CEUSTIGMA_g7987.t1 [Chlamydomonas eustigma]